MESSRGKKADDQRNEILHENAFERFESGKSSLRKMVKFIEARKSMEADIARTLTKFVEDWTKVLNDNMDMEYGAMRRMWREVIFENLETAHLHTQVKTELARADGPLETARASLEAALNDRSMDLMQFYRESKNKHAVYLDNIARAKKIYYEKCRRYNALDEQMCQKRYRSKSTPKYLEDKLKLDRLHQEIVTSRFQYQKRLLEEQGARILFLANMREVKEEFDRMEKARLRVVKQTFMELMDVSELQDRREGRNFTVNELRHNLETMNLDEEVKEYDKTFMKNYEIPTYEEFHGQKDESPTPPVKEEQEKQVEEVVEQYDNRRLDFAPAKDEAVYPILLPSLQMAPPVIETKEEPLWWADIRPGKKTIDPLVEPPPYTLRDVANSFIESNLSRGRKANRTPHMAEEEQDIFSEFSPGATANMLNVKVKAVRGYTGRGPGELSFKIGQTLKQKTAADANGMAYGWMKKSRTGRKRYGYFPVALVQLKPRKVHTPLKERFARALSRRDKFP